MCVFNCLITGLDLVGIYYTKSWMVGDKRTLDAGTLLRISAALVKVGGKRHRILYNKFRLIIAMVTW